jgi:hypothetical protein
MAVMIEGKLCGDATTIKQSKRHVYNDYGFVL